MAERYIKIRPRGARAEQQQTPTKSGEQDRSPRQTAHVRYKPWLAAGGVLILAVSAWLLIPQGGEEKGEDLMVETSSHGANPDLSAYALRDAFLTRSPEELYDVIRGELRISNEDRLSVLRAYRSAVGGRIWPTNKIDIYAERNNTMRDALMLVQPDPPIVQIAIHLGDSIHARIMDMTVESRRQTSVIDLWYGSLIKDLMNAKMPWQIVPELESAFEYTIDMHHLNVGDTLKIIYEEYLSEDKVLGIKEVSCFQFVTDQGTYFAFRYEDGNGYAYFDKDGKSMKRRFLKAPVKYTAITSPFGLRMHPIDEQVHIHKGIDYAAPEGTPIHAIADGEVTIAGNKAKNGKYIKIRHDGVYQSQYLHMSRFESGIRPGKPVRQGDIIGYVGQTGSATGPHVCFRLWKENEQVNFIEEEARDAKPMRYSAWPDFKSYRDSLLQKLNTMQ